MKLAIDPGHGTGNRKPGEYDPGAVYAGIREADVVLFWALTVKHVLAQAGIAVWMTRDDPDDPAPVGSRDERAELARCTHFLSLHCNGGGWGRASGVETFYRDERDRRWARMVHGAAIIATGLPSRRVRHESQTQVKRLAIMDFDGPCALLETGYLDHSTDRAVITRREVRIAFAEAMLERVRVL